MRHHVESFLPVGLSDVDYTGAFHDQVGSSTVHEPLRTRLGFVFWPGFQDFDIQPHLAGVRYQGYPTTVGTYRWITFFVEWYESGLRTVLGTLQTFVIILCGAVGA